jgi:polysaccharide export outer membrane protein
MKPIVHFCLLIFLGSLVSCDPIPGKNGSNRFDPRAHASQVDSSGAMTTSANFKKFNGTGSISKSMLRPKTDDYRLGQGDNLTIELTDKPETRQVTRVMPDGLVYFDLAQGVPAEGKTIEELTAAITKKMQVFEQRPLVRVTLYEITSRNYFILGQVNTPGTYPLTRPLTVLDAISEAGGLASALNADLESLPDLSSAYIVRKNKMLPVDFQSLVEGGDTSQNIYLEPDDYIYIPSTQDAKVYLLGSVTDPKSITYKGGTTLVSALARAGGPTPKAYRQKTIILRGSLTKPEYAIVDFNQVLNGGATDVPLEPGDIVWMPRSPWEKAEEYLVQVVSAAAQSVAVYQGGRLVDPDAAQPATIGIQ